MSAEKSMKMIIFSMFRIDLTWVRRYVWNKVVIVEWLQKMCVKSTVILAHLNWLRLMDKPGNSIQSLSATCHYIL